MSYKSAGPQSRKCKDLHGDLRADVMNLIAKTEFFLMVGKLYGYFNW